MRRYRAVLLGALLLAASTGAAGEGNDAGLEPEPAQQAIERASGFPRIHSLLVAREGRVEIERSFDGPGTARPANIKSLSKTILSALVGIAIERGVFSGAEQPVTQLLDGTVPEEADPRIERITLAHLLSMQSGLERTSGRNYGRWVTSEDWVAHVLTRPFVDEPGGRMRYSTGNSHLLSAALTSASGRSTHALAQDWLGEPLGIAVPSWMRDPQGIYFGGNEMRLSPRALLAIGELYRRGGRHEGEQLIPQHWIEASWTPRGRSRFNHDDYGYGWFITELAGRDTYYGWGFGGQMLYVIPALELTVVITSDPTPPSPGGRYLRRLHALVAETLIPAAERAPGAR